MHVWAHQVKLMESDMVLHGQLVQCTCMHGAGAEVVSFPAQIPPSIFLLAGEVTFFVAILLAKVGEQD